ncbi:hypothetical protein FKM82_021792 [Ascaphus truei]
MPRIHSKTSPALWLSAACLITSRLLGSFHCAEVIQGSFTAPFPRTDITKCVVTSEPGLRSHWLVSSACNCGHFFKAVIFFLLRER